MSQYGLDLIKKLSPIKFKYDQSKFSGKIDKRIHLGLSAQELIEILPEEEFAVVHKDSQGFLMVDYTELISPLISAVKELDNKIEKLENEITMLKKANPQGES